MFWNTAKKTERFAFVPTTIMRVDENGAVIPMTITDKDIERCIDEVDSDPTAGHGLFTKRQLLVDKLMRLINTSKPADQKSRPAPAPILSEAKPLAAKKEAQKSALRSVPTDQPVQAPPAQTPFDLIPSTELKGK